MPSGRFMTRMPPELHEQLADAAARSNRSLNAEIVHRLQATFSDEFDQRVAARSRTMSEASTQGQAVPGISPEAFAKLTAAVSSAVMKDIVHQVEELAGVKAEPASAAGQGAGEIRISRVRPKTRKRTGRSQG